jgi:hypothetical protein
MKKRTAKRRMKFQSQKFARDHQDKRYPTCVNLIIDWVFKVLFECKWFAIACQKARMLPVRPTRTNSAPSVRPIYLNRQPESPADDERGWRVGLPGFRAGAGQGRRLHLRFRHFSHPPLPQKIFAGVLFLLTRKARDTNSKKALAVVATASRRRSGNPGAVGPRLDCFVAMLLAMTDEGAHHQYLATTGASG